MRLTLAGQFFPRFGRPLQVIKKHVAMQNGFHGGNKLIPFLAQGSNDRAALSTQSPGTENRVAVGR